MLDPRNFLRRGFPLRPEDRGARRRPRHRHRQLLLALPRRTAPLQGRHGPRRLTRHDRDRRLAPAGKTRRRFGDQRRVARARWSARDRRPRQRPQHRLPLGRRRTHLKPAHATRLHRPRLTRRRPGDRPPTRRERPRHTREHRLRARHQPRPPRRRRRTDRRSRLRRPPRTRPRRIKANAGSAEAPSLAHAEPA
jgi:hypothetical protein